MQSSKRDVLLVLLATFLFGLLLNQRALGGIFDLGCPTWLANMANQIRSGIFPAEFLAMPGVPANYHQGTVLVSAILMKIFDVNAATSFRVVIVGFGTIVFALICLSYSVLIGVGRTLFLAVVCYFSASINYSLHWPLDGRSVGWHDYISLFEYQTSSSWPITFLLLFFVFQFVGSQLIKRNTALMVGLLLLPIFNATAFSILFLTTITLLILEFANYVKKYEISNDVVACGSHNLLWIAGFIAAYFWPKLYTSAMIVGGNYESLEVALRFRSDNFTEEIKQLLRLHTFFNYVSWLPALLLLREKGFERRFSASIFIISFVFPFVFGIKPINSWDNFHKFVLLSSFFSIFVWIEHFSRKRSELLNWFFIIGGSISLFLSIPSIYNQATSRFAVKDFFLEASAQQADSSGLLEFLNEQKRRPMLWVYPPPKDMCSTSVDDLIGNTNIAVAGLYFNNFLLSHKLEIQIGDDYHWSDGDPRVLQKRYPNLIHFYISKKDDWPVFLGHMQSKNIPIETLGDYGVFTIGKNIIR
jgi:hypothetical protein